MLKYEKFVIVDYIYPYFQISIVNNDEYYTLPKIKDLNDIINVLDRLNGDYKHLVFCIGDKRIFIQNKLFEKNISYTFEILNLYRSINIPQYNTAIGIIAKMKYLIKNTSLIKPYI